MSDLTTDPGPNPNPNDYLAPRADTLVFSQVVLYVIIGFFIYKMIYKSWLQ